MGFLDFFRKKPEPPKSPAGEFTVEELNVWLAEQKSQEYESLGKKTGELQKLVLEEKETLKANLQVLQKAEPRNKDLPERIKHVMEGNRQIYLQKTNALLEKLVLPKRTEELLSFIKEFDKELDHFDRSISKSHQIMEEIFQEKASVIAKGIKKIDKSFKEIDSHIKGSKLEGISRIQEDLAALLSMKSHSLERKKSILHEKEELSAIKKEISRKEARLAGLQKEDEYVQLQKSLAEKEKIQKEISDLRSRIRGIFSEVEPALKKYENLSQSKLSLEYLTDPIEALHRDEGLEIAKIFQAAHKAILAGEITLKDKKREKILSTLLKLDSSFLQGLLKEESSLGSRLDEAQSVLESSQLLKEIHNMKSAIKKETLEYEDKLARLEKNAKPKLNDSIEESRNMIENNIRQLLNAEIRIII